MKTACHRAQYQNQWASAYQFYKSVPWQQLSAKHVQVIHFYPADYLEMDKLCNHAQEEIVQ
jgi:hypothetical protein